MIFRNKKNLKLILFLFLSISFLIFIQGTNVLAEDSVENGQNLTSEEAYTLLENINESIIEMNDSGFNTQRIEDIYNEADQIYSAQNILEDSGREADYSSIFEYYSSVEDIKDNALEVQDEVFSLEKTISSMEEENMNVSEALSLLDEVKQEMQDERYEKALEKVPNVRDKIAEIRSESTAARTVYLATKKTLKDFFSKNWEIISIVVLVLVGSYFIFKKRILIAIYSKKLEKLKLEKKTIKNLVQEAQKKYFEKGTLPENTYRTKTQKYGEMIRDIDRKIPLVHEQLVKLEKSSKEKNKNQEN